MTGAAMELPHRTIPVDFLPAGIGLAQKREHGSVHNR